MKVRLKSALTIGSQTYPPGAELELPDEQAEELIKMSVVEPIDKGRKEAKK